MPSSSWLNANFNGTTTRVTRSLIEANYGLKLNFDGRSDRKDLKIDNKLL